VKNIIESFDYWVSFSPEKLVFVSLEENIKVQYSYSELNEIVNAKYWELLKSNTEESAILLYNDTIGFLSSFLACQRLGIISIPMFYPRNGRHYDRLKVIIESSNSKLILCSSKDKLKISESLNSLDNDLIVLGLDVTACESVENIETNTNPISFIQYTSGSTSDPKGVIISQDNLMHNQKMLAEIFNCNSDSVILSWLPFYHDMGLIGNLLHTIYVGCTCIVMKPATVVGNPMIWLESIKKYEVTHSGGPNFIYDLCNEKINDQQIGSLDLSSLKVAYNGSEPIKLKTVAKFITKFKNTGFKESAYRTCYGLAESTLVVSGGIPETTNESITSGKVASELDLVFYNNETNEVSQKSGEICISGASVTSGYWKKKSDEYFIIYKGNQYLKTGDLGVVNDGQLIINGRLKEMLIINGENIFPYDIELALTEQNEVLLSNGISLSEEDGALFVFAELNRANINEESEFYENVRTIINKILIDMIGVHSNSIVFVSPLSLPRTSSGKIKRTQIVSQWRENNLSVINSQTEIIVEEKNFDLQNFEWTVESVESYLESILKEKLKISDATDFENNTFFELGLSSIKGVELVNQISQDLEIELELKALFELNQLNKVSQYILDLKWLQSSITEGEEIEL
jgi:acyl-CoA synthetase (AMP-forming)/AMP-acid ligase II/acyl carrier protein